MLIHLQGSNLFLFIYSFLIIKFDKGWFHKHWSYVSLKFYDSTFLLFFRYDLTCYFLIDLFEFLTNAWVWEACFARFLTCVFF